MRFLHAADLHIDSPLRGLSAYAGAPLERIREATRAALVNLVDLALEEQVQFVVIAGDLFDGTWRDMGTGLWTAQQFRRLEKAGIPVFLLRGNHDAQSKMQQELEWPANVQRFDVNAPQTIRLDDLGVALHGQGFMRQECPEDLASRYPAAIPGYFNLGVLHTSLTGTPEHDTYAPTRLDVLRGKEYDYWALGHIHTRGVPISLREPFVAFSGNTQGRSVRETGPKGVFIVDVDGSGPPRTTFRETDVVRWHIADVRAERNDDLESLLEKTEAVFRSCHAADGNRLSAVRVRISGACLAQQRLKDQSHREQMEAQIRDVANGFDGDVWAEKVIIETSLTVDLEELRCGNDLMGAMLQQIDSLRSDPAALAELAADLDPLSKKWTAELREAGIDLQDHRQLEHWLQQAETLLASQLWEAGS